MEVSALAMSFKARNAYVTVYRDGSFLLTTSTTIELRRPDGTRIGQRIKLDTDDWGCAYDVHRQRVAVSRDGARFVEIIEPTTLQTSRIESGGARLTCLIDFDASGQSIVVQTTKSISIFGIEDWTRTDFERGVYHESLDFRSNSLLVAARAAGQLRRIHLAQRVEDRVCLPVAATFHYPRVSPDGTRVVVIDRTRTAHGLSLPDLDLQWSSDLKPILGRGHTSSGCFSGSGALFCAGVADYDRNYGIVLDAETGTVLGATSNFDFPHPWKGDSIFNRRVSAGGMASTLDLRTNTQSTVYLW